MLFCYQFFLFCVSLNYSLLFCNYSHFDFILFVCPYFLCYFSSKTGGISGSNIFICYQFLLQNYRLPFICIGPQVDSLSGLQSLICIVSCIFLGPLSFDFFQLLQLIFQTIFFLCRAHHFLLFLLPTPNIFGPKHCYVLSTIL